VFNQITGLVDAADSGKQFISDISSGNIGGAINDLGYLVGDLQGGAVGFLTGGQGYESSRDFFEGLNTANGVVGNLPGGLIDNLSGKQNKELIQQLNDSAAKQEQILANKGPEPL
jgi:hypothetical protein